MQRHDEVVIGVDVGGTKILLGYVTQGGTVCRSQRYPMDRSTQATALASVRAAVDDFVRAPWEGPVPIAIGVGVVGQVHPASGTWVQSMNVPIRTPVRLAGQLQARYSLPVAIDNDVHAATLAEMRLGAGRGSKDLIYVNVGTGVACGIVCGGQLLRGVANYAGELGHIVVEVPGEPCPCGHQGCLESIASGEAIITQARTRLANFPASPLAKAAQEGRLTSGTVFQAADAGDSLALAIAERAIRGLGIALVDLLNLLNPEVVVLGGGVLSDGWLLPRLREYVVAHALPAASRSLKALVPSDLGVDQVGLLGAATLAWEKIEARV